MRGRNRDRSKGWKMHIDSKQSSTYHQPHRTTTRLTDEQVGDKQTHKHKDGPTDRHRQVPEQRQTGREARKERSRQTVKQTDG